MGFLLDSLVRGLVSIGYIVFAVIAYNTNMDPSLFALALFSISEISDQCNWTIR